MGSGIDYICSNRFAQDHQRQQGLQRQKAAVAARLEASCTGRYRPTPATTSAALRRHVAESDEKAAKIMALCRKAAAQRGMARPPGRRGEAATDNPRGCITAHQTAKRGGAGLWWQGYYENARGCAKLKITVWECTPDWNGSRFVPKFRACAVPTTISPALDWRSRTTASRAR